MNYVQGKVPRFEPPRVFQYTFAMGQNDKASRATIGLVPETEATRVTVRTRSGPRMPHMLPAQMANSCWAGKASTQPPLLPSIYGMPIRSI
jgi:uncharacterized protein YndB with AHSA1/START domain